METEKMIVIPKETPIIQELNSYYLNMDKLFEYYQGIVDAGCIHFQLPPAEGVIFFDAFNLINGTYRGADVLISGKEAVDRLLAEAKSTKVLLSIYEIPPEKIAFWANVANAEDLYKDLSTEFTDLDGLIRKMTVDRLTGYIEVAFSKDELALLFMHNGQVIGAISAESKWQLVRSQNMQTELIERSRKVGAMLNVRRILLDQVSGNTSVKNNGKKAPSASKVDEKPAAAPPEPEPEPEFEYREEYTGPLRIIEMLQYLMLIYEKFISSNRKIRNDFDTILKQKFVQKADRYGFLDPFSEEFKYAKGRIEYTGKADERRLATGLLECLREIAAENDMQKWLDKSLWPLREKYSREIDELNIEF
jgi:hypothetical protein